MSTYAVYSSVCGGLGFCNEFLRCCLPTRLYYATLMSLKTKVMGGIDKRICEVITRPVVLERLRHNNSWVGLYTVVKVTAERTVIRTGETRTNTESRYYTCSDEEPSAKRLQKAVREHWGVENYLHWTIDMAFREDESKIRTGNVPANMAVLRHISLNIIRGDTTRKVGIKISRGKAGRSTAYLEKLLGW